jgi:Sulfotransferase family
MSISPHSPPILVTGCHRSGTTWLGNLLAASPGIGYIGEVFNLDHPMPGACAARFRHQYMHLTEENGRAYVQPMRQTLGFEFDWGDAARALRKPRQLRRAPENAARFRAAHRRRLRPLLKDPIAFFSAEWLARTFGMRVVVTVRHPGGFAASLKRLGYGFDFHEFLGQPALMRDHLDPYRAEIEAFAAEPRPIVDQAGLLWRCVYGTAARLRQAHPEWQFVRHEDLSLHPREQLEPICRQLEIPFDEAIAARIAETTAADNPTDAPAGRAHQLRRNSAANVDAWRSRLDAGEVARLRAVVGPELGAFYDERTWTSG